MTKVTVVEQTTTVVQLPPANPSVVTVNAPGTQVQTSTTIGSVVQLKPARPATATLGIPGPAGPIGPTGAAGGTSETRTASETLGGHRIVRATGAGAVGYASTDNPLHGDDTVGLTLGAAVAGDPVEVQQRGRVVHAGWSWTPQTPVFLGRDGLMTQIAPDPAAGDYFHQEIGFAEDATSLQLNIDSPIYFA